MIGSLRFYERREVKDLLSYVSAALVPVGAAVNSGDGIGRTQHPRDTLMEVVERVAVLRENDEFALAPGGIAHFGVVLEDAGKLIPLAVLAGGDDGLGLVFEPDQNVYFILQLGDGLGRRGLVNEVFFEILLLLGVEVVFVFGRCRRLRGGRGIIGCESRRRRWSSRSTGKTCVLLARRLRECDHRIRSRSR